MPLELGRSFDRSYSMRMPFLDGFFNIGVFFHKNSNFLLFRVDQNFRASKSKHGIKINMFKNLETSIFCETFLDLHDYRSDRLDICSQFNKVKDDYYNEIIFLCNESITLSKHTLNEKSIYSTVLLYGITMAAYENEFLFLIAERQHIIVKLKKKIVRTTGIQISTSQSLNALGEFYSQHKEDLKLIVPNKPKLDPQKIIKLSDVNGEET